MMTVQAEFPAMRLDNFPRIECGFYPTPLEELTRLREAIGATCPRLFIKRDDLIGTGFGGNKVRKLDYVMAREIERGTQTVVTIAGEKSNHARVTAAVCARLGLRCLLVLNRAAKGVIPDGFKAASRFIYELYGAEVRWVDSREEREATALALTAQLQAKGERAAYIPLGVSFPLGALGFVRAVHEVTEQFEKIGVRPNYIFHSSSSGGTQAGLIAGCQLFGDGRCEVIGISPDDPANEIAECVAEIVNGIHQLLGTDEYKISAAQVQVLEQYIGAGYGIETSKAIAITKMLATREGIILDPTYTAKAFAALMDWIQNGKLTARDTILFWHTGGQLAFFYVPE